MSLSRITLASAALLALAGCNSESSRYPARAYAPIPADTLALFSKKNTDRNAPIVVRAYKRESEIEIWKRANDGQYVHVKTYPVCRWSGQLGPKKREGDRQVPEGFYTVAASQMNPNSAYWLSFNVGYPNQLERAMGRNGGDIMVHGTCSSRGCFAMTNEQIEEIYAVMREAFNGGQRQVQFQSYPFRMTAENMAKFRHDPNLAFWKNLKEGSDNFEVTKAEPKVGYCGGKYIFNAESASGRLDAVANCPPLRPTDPSVAQAVAAKQHQDDQKVAELVQRGTPAIRVAYSDGGQNASFRNTGYSNADSGEMVMAEATSRKGINLGDVSRPEAVDAVEEYAVNERGERKDAPKIETAKVESAKVVPAKGEPAKPASAQAAVPAPAVQAVAAMPAPAAAPSTTMALAPAQQPANSGGTLSALGSWFGGSKPAADTTSAPASAPVASAPEAKPFYKRWLGLGASETAAPADTNAAPAPVNVPLPPKRQATATEPQKVSMATGAGLGVSAQ
jgi:murein L,D-transpeptidase YafK